jgi:uncharacterized protein YndB with AHSA1/START domain/DNA-binding transcriptional ArsR family regulator
VAQSDRVEVIQEAARAVVALHPIRLKILELLRVPASPTTLSKSLGIPRQHLNYHVRELESAGLVEMVEEKRKGSVVERLYQATSRSYIVSPKAMGDLRISPGDVEDRFSSDYLLAVGSKLIEDVVNLREHRAVMPQNGGKSRVLPNAVSAYTNRRRQTIPTMALEAEIGFASDADRTAFSREITAAVSRIAATYNKDDGEKFRVAIFAHPNVAEGQDMSIVETREATATEEKKDLTKVSYEVFVLASKENVFDALTRPERLKHWAGEYIEVDPHVGGSYTVWGANSYGAPGHGDARGEILSMESPDRISITRNFPYGKGAVTFTLIEKEYGTSVEMESSLPGNEIEHTHFLNADFVELSLYNLRSYIETGEMACKPDFTGRKDKMTVSTAIAAPATAVFVALTDPDQMDKWVSSGAEVQLRKNGRYSYGWTEIIDGRDVDTGPTRIIDFVPNRLLIHGWEWPGEADQTTVTWDVVEEKGVTAVTLTHSGFTVEGKIEGYIQGWAAFLGKLKALLEEKSFVSRSIALDGS